MLPVLLLQAGNPPKRIREQHGSFADMVIAAAGLDAANVEVKRIYADERPASAPHYRAVIITGSPANVTDQDPWIARTAGWIRDAMDADLPMFGICFGHQLMCQALGGRVDFHPEGFTIATGEIRLTDAGIHDKLFAGVPRQFPAHLLHGQVVFETPPAATVLAHSVHDRHQALRLSDKAVSVQFHPEFTTAVMQQYCDELAVARKADAIDFSDARQKIQATPDATSILRRFIKELALRDRS